MVARSPRRESLRSRPQSRPSHRHYHQRRLHHLAPLPLSARAGAVSYTGFDAWSPALRGENLYEAARKAAPHTAITTNADYTTSPRYRYQPALVLSLIQALTHGPPLSAARIFTKPPAKPPLTPPLPPTPTTPPRPVTVISPRWCCLLYRL